MRRVLFASPLLFAFLTACASLEHIEAGVCGNGVIDRDKNEDCDSWENNGFACQKDGEWACSYQCKNGTCPSGYGCGADGICRRPTGQFAEEPFMEIPTEANELMAGDFDADGRADVVAIEPGHLRIHFIGSSGEVQQASFSSLLRPSIGKLGNLSDDPNDTSADRGDDLVLPLNLGIGALISSADRTFSAKAYSSVGFEKPLMNGIPGRVSDVLPLAIDALPGSGTVNSGDEMAALVALSIKQADGTEEQYQTGIFVDFGTASEPVFVVEGGAPSNLTGPPVTGRFDSNSCQQIAFPIRGRGELNVYRTCTYDFGQLGYVWARYGTKEEAAILAHIDLQGDAISGPAFAFDVNADGHMDLLVTTSGAGTGLQLRVAYGMDNGVFSSTPPVLGQKDGNNAASLYAVLTAPENVNGHVPLALGDLNLDGYPDLVDSRQVLFGGPGFNAVPAVFTATYTSLRPWDEAIVADVNGNGYPDVVASSKDARDIDVLGGNPTTFINPLQLPTDGKVAHLTAGDYDGDLVSDIAFQDALTSTESQLMIAFGRAAGGPEEPTKVGTFPGIDRIVSGNVHSFQSDNISDLGVTTGIHPVVDGQTIALSFLPGSANRFILAPFFLADAAAGQFNVPLHTALGSLSPQPPKGGAAHNDLAVLAEAPLPPSVDAISVPGLKLASNSLRLWAVVGAGEAEFTAAQAMSCHLKQGPFYAPGLEQVLSIVVPPDAPGTVFMSAPYLDFGAKGEILVSSVLAQEGPPAPEDPLICFEGKRYLGPPGQILYRVKLVDLDGNGTPEILAVVLQYEADKLAGRLAGQYVQGDDGQPLGPISSALVVFWDATEQGKPLEPDFVTDAKSMVVTDYAVGDTDGDELPEVFAVGWFGRIRYTLEKDKQSLVPDADVETAVLKPDADAPTAVLVADADGDGVNDLVTVSALSTLQVYKGIPRTLVRDQDNAVGVK